MRGRTGIGIIVLVIGFVYLLQQFGLFLPPAIWISGKVIWPLLILLVGLFGLKGMQFGRIPWGHIFLILLGLSYTLKGLDIFPWLDRVGYQSLFWALLTILVGFYLLVPKKSGRSYLSSTEHTGRKNSRNTRNPEEPFFNKQAGNASKRMIGDLSIGRNPWVLEDMTLRSGIGDIRINLATAHVDEGSYTIAVRAFVGDIRMIVPESLAVCIDAHVGLGDLDVFGNTESGTGRTVHFQTAGYESASRRCHIVLAIKIGDIEIVRV